MVWAERSVQDRQLGNYVVRVAVYSVVFATALRFFQIHLFMQDQLALRPPFEKGVRQIVFIAPNFDFYTQDFVQNDRSEEHTSELQSPCNLVCRLLLEKTKRTRRS